MNILTNAKEEDLAMAATGAGEKLASMIRAEDNVGDLLSLNYDTATILVHDSLRQKVKGLPMGCFLIATRITPGTSPDASDEDTALLLLRVVDDAALPNKKDTETYRLDAGFRSIETEKTYDDTTDQFTLNQLRHAGVSCDILGTFRMIEKESQWKLTFGADISNFYSGQGMKIYKPVEETLVEIVNYTKPTGAPHPLAGNFVPIGRVRYCASEIESGTGRENVKVNMDPSDLIARRTALFGMSRSGKSNTVKIIASSLFNMRSYNLEKDDSEKDDSEKRRIGQLIFDVNGEYCNDNPQDDGCLRKIGGAEPNTENSDVVTYGLFQHSNDPNRNLLKINFLGDDIKLWDDRTKVEESMVSLIAGKEAVDEILSKETAGYIKNFYNTPLDVPDNEWGRGDQNRYRKVIQIYRAILIHAGFTPATKTAYIKDLFGSDFRKFLAKDYPNTAENLANDQVSWDIFYDSMKDVEKFIRDDKSFADFDEGYKKDKKKSWADDKLRGILSIFENTRGARLIGLTKDQHAPTTEGDYSDKIVEDVREGKLVIVDQATGSPELVKIATERIMLKLFDAQKGDFIRNIESKSVIVYAEEAHNLLPAKASPEELRSIWARTAKEGSKFNIGMVYSTQEPSSILPNILKNTDNWFVAHLNNTDEVKELKKYYDFTAFAGQILKVPDTGFLRMRCLSNPYIVPVQVDIFNADSGQPKTGKSGEAQTNALNADSGQGTK